MSIQALLICILLTLAALAAPACGYGKSVEDLVGAFSIEKTIKLGDSGCFNSDTMDPLADPTTAMNGPVVSSGASPLSMEDGMAPSLAAFDFGPKAVNATSYPQAVYFTAHVVDDESGLSWSNGSVAHFVSPSRSEEAVASFLPSNMTGSRKDGVYGATLVVPRGSEKGLWLLESMTLTDAAGNRKVMTRDDLLRLGMPSEMLVE